MQEAAVFVVIEIVSVQDPAALGTYVQRASKLIGSMGGEVIGQGGAPVGQETSFGTLVIQRRRSENAFRSWLDSEAYQPLSKILRASATMRAAIVPIAAV